MLVTYWGLTFNNQCNFHQDDFAIDDSDGDSDKRTNDKMRREWHDHPRRQQMAFIGISNVSYEIVPFQAKVLWIEWVHALCPVHALIVMVILIKGPMTKCLSCEWQWHDHPKRQQMASTHAFPICSTDIVSFLALHRSFNDGDFREI